MTLKGQNFRILTQIGSGVFQCVGMATSCTVTLNNNTDDTGTKDDVGLSSKPTAISKSWSVSVESLDVQDAAAMLAAIKSLTPFRLVWDETQTTDNQMPSGASYTRAGDAFLNDLALTFNDREISSKSLQFTGTSGLQRDSNISYIPVSHTAYTFGQYVRLFLSDNQSTTPIGVIAAAKQLSLHISLSLEVATTKDTDGLWQVQQPTALSYDISTSALVRGADNITSDVGGKGFDEIQSIYNAGTPVKWEIANVSGANQRTKGAVIVSGLCLLTQLTVNAAVRQSATYEAQLTGYGEYTVAA